MILEPRALRRPLSALVPGVRWIETAELASELDGPAELRPLLLDARTAAEHALSHLDGARRIDPGASDPDVTAPSKDAPIVGAPSKDAPIVAYCAVGYRSALLCRHLAARGYTDVRNLSGGVFQWANEGRPLHADGRIVGRVHPFSRVWGWWLEPRVRGAP